jgi:hypothetical protein
MRRAWFSIAAGLLSAVALIVSVLDNAPEPLGFFAVATLAALIQAWCLRDPEALELRRLAVGIALAWVAGAIFIGVMLLVYQSGTRPPPAAEKTYLGLTATVYHVIGVYGGALATLIAAVGPRRWLER